MVKNKLLGPLLLHVSLFSQDERNLEMLKMSWYPLYLILDGTEITLHQGLVGTRHTAEPGNLSEVSHSAGFL